MPEMLCRGLVAIPDSSKHGTFEPWNMSVEVWEAGSLLGRSRCRPAIHGQVLDVREASDTKPEADEPS
ncbi:hypothetical protein M419DRAFT_24468 [Trichoderma reesei RUT C-30]|uniref:Uncharacterized protein n=1 Tax=Hypocrea jecorina (strain ATCC 56765 / BCRC 32924 / NRRL 11460 / Rut C-30) TaxID=1344414 RepID=A0A024SBP1_HYPJR|nr:hypothetical protein M419DRAFT_24468 [Trichoderma reesei RUT C-30]